MLTHGGLSHSVQQSCTNHLHNITVLRTYINIIFFLLTKVREVLYDPDNILVCGLKGGKVIELYYVSLAVYIKDTNHVLRHLRDSLSKQNAISGRRKRVLERHLELIKS